MLRSRKLAYSFTNHSSKKFNKHSHYTVTDEAQSLTSVGWVGPITLHRRAKPELENERHKDVSLSISVQEAKNVSLKGRYFCEIRLDRTLYARTTSKLSDGTVFWGEQFELNNLPPISILTINLYRQAGSIKAKSKRDQNKCQNQFVAYITVPLTDTLMEVNQPHLIDIQQWFAMQDPQSTFQNVRIEDGFGCDFGISSNCPDQGQLVDKSRFRKQSSAASCFRQTINTVASTGSSASNCKQGVDEPSTRSSVPNSYNLFGKNKKKNSWTVGETGALTSIKMVAAMKEPLGENSLPNSGCDSTRSSSSSCPTPNSQSANSAFILSDNLSLQLRLKIYYQTMDVLPLNYYDELKQFLKTHYMTLIKCLESKLSAKQKQEWATCFVNIFEKSPDLSIADFFKNVLQADLHNVNSKESMIFRSNSIGSKAMECYVKLVGNDYLQHVLNSTIGKILVTDEEFEVDPTRFTNPGSESAQSARLDRNANVLVKYVNLIWDRIKSSLNKLPKELIQLFTHLGSMIEDKYGLQASIHLLSSCLFLRYICPAIHGPVLFGLASAVPEQTRVSRNLTLVAKVLQTIANLAPFEDKEVHMKRLNGYVEHEIPLMRQLLCTISSVAGELNQAILDSAKCSNCHQFIDLGYEYAKLCQLLQSQISDIQFTPELENVSAILNHLDEFLDNNVFTCPMGKGTSTNGVDDKCLSDNLDNFIQISKNIEFDMSTNAHSNMSETTYSPVYDPTNLSSNPSCINYKKYSSQESVNHQSDIHLAHLNTNQSKSKITISNDNTMKKQAHTYAWHSQDLEDTSKSSPFQMRAQLMHRYQEQMQELHQCIDQVEKPIDDVTLSRDYVAPTLVYTKHLEEKLANGECEAIYANAPMLFYSRFAKSNGNGETVPKSTPPLMNHNLANSNGYVKQISNSKLIDSEYDGDDDVDEVVNDYEDDVNSDELTDVSNFPNLPNDQSEDEDDDNDEGIGGKVNSYSKSDLGLSESPSLDQLAERLQELKTMLQLERQEIQQVVASKTQVIREQERSIEQLESELNQLKREHKPSNGNHVHRRYRSRGMIHLKTNNVPRNSSPASFSSSSERCRTDRNTTSGPQFNGKSSAYPPTRYAFTNTQRSTSNHQTPKHEYSHLNVKADQQLTKTCGLDFDSLGRPQCLTSYGGCDSNLFYLSKTSEHMGIPMGHLIEQSHPPSICKAPVPKTTRMGVIQRRFSESKLSPKF